MGKTKIGWTDKTWNPWQGCTKVSPGCANCYMYTAKARYGQDPEVVVRSKTVFDAPLKWDEPQRIFLCSWSDFFHKAADPWRAEAWEIIRQTKHHTYQILTKRHGRIVHCLPPGWPGEFSHVHLGVSAENEYWFNKRVAALGQILAAVRFVSLEPLLGPIDCGNAFDPASDGSPYFPIDWVIVGGESGPNYRSMQTEWVESIVAQCDAASVPVFVKQASGPFPGRQGLIPDDLWARKEFPEAAT